MTENKPSEGTYSCHMIVADSEIAACVMKDHGFEITDQFAGAILVNACPVQHHAEQKIWNSLSFFRSLKKKNPEPVAGLIGEVVNRIDAPWEIQIPK